MIEPKELRIGNYVYMGNNTVFPDKIQDISSTIISSELFSAFSPETLYPIPLTQDWIEKLGADNLGYYFIEKGSTWNSPVGEDGFFFGMDEEGGIEICRVKFVHQLQNLVYDITGKELTLKQ